MYHKSKVTQYTDNFYAIDFMNLVNMVLSFYIEITVSHLIVIFKTVLFVGLCANRAFLDDLNDEYISNAF